jgi:dihydroorotase (multifunctional complex type)
LIVDLILNRGKAYLNNKLVDCSLAIDQSRIFKIGKDPNMPQAERKIDLKNMIVLPGLIDAHVHLRDERNSYKENFYSGTAAAAAGGITTVLDMPNNDPVTMSTNTLKRRIEIARRKTLVNIGFYSEFPKNIEKSEEIIREGATAFKLYLAERIGGLNIDDDHILTEAFRILSNMDVPVAVHAEDRKKMEEKKDQFRFCNHKDIQAFLEVHSEHVEASAIERLVKVAGQTDVHLHVCHLSSETGLKAVMDGKKNGVKITCEVTPHHLLLSVDDLMKLGGLSLTVPPVRAKSHAEVLWNALKREWIDIVASDHAPHTLDEKKSESIWDIKPGIPGLETTLPLLLNEIKHGRLSLTELVRLMSKNPARIFRLEGKGLLKEGNDADLTVVDLNKKFKINASKFYSKAEYSPFDGIHGEGKPVKTFIGGCLVMDEGEIVAKAGTGRVIERE